jgi:acyl-CoA synthetase (AMP-forming)/AMP-acid ligase II
MLQLSTLIAHHARYFPGKPAVGFEDVRLDWGAFGARVNRVANALRALGVAPGDRVATVCTNCLELLETYWAVPTAGAVLVPLSPLLLASGLASLLKDAGARALVTQRALLPLLAEADLLDLDPVDGLCVGSPAPVVPETTLPTRAWGPLRAVASSEGVALEGPDGPIFRATGEPCRFRRVDPSDDGLTLVLPATAQPVTIEVPWTVVGATLDDGAVAAGAVPPGPAGRVLRLVRG